MTADYTKIDGRRQRSRVTRVRVIDAAAGLFLERGYVAATIEDVAERAGVAVQTVYYVFGTKPKLLSAVLDASIAGDAEPVPVLERPWVAALREQHDVGSAMERLVNDSVTILSRTSPLYEVVRRAAADPEVNQLLQDTRRRRRADQRALIEILSKARRLRPDLDVDTAADVFYGLINEEVFQLFVGDCGWDVERLKRWATSLMMQQLIGEAE